LFEKILKKAFVSRNLNYTTSVGLPSYDKNNEHFNRKIIIEGRSYNLSYGTLCKEEEVKQSIEEFIDNTLLVDMSNN
jgi:hypothetical protein